MARNRRTVITGVGVGAALLLGVLLVAQSPPPRWPIGDAPVDLKPTISRADVLIAAQHGALLRQLKQAIREGAATAIQACHLEVTSQAYWVGRQEGISIGRTSDRLRSPTNAPRPWAAPIVHEYAGRKAADVEGFAVDLGDRVGVIRPIVMQPICAGCHGTPGAFEPPIAAVLADQYPRDRAVGFSTGEIRGWYWVELPKPAKDGR